MKIKIHPFFTFWLKNYRVSFLLMAMLVILGIASLIFIPKENNPEIEFGMISVNTLYTGASPEDIDNLITRKIYKEIKDIDGIKKIDANSLLGMSNIVLELDNDADVNDVMTEVRSSVDTVDIPTDAEDPVVSELDVGFGVIYSLAFYDPNDSLTDPELDKIARQLSYELENLSEVKAADVSIDENPTIEIQVSEDKIQGLGLSLQSITQKIKDSNANIPLGNYTIDDKDYDFRIEGEIKELDELKNIVIAGEGQSSVTLGDVAKIYTKYPEGISRLGSYQLSGKKYRTIALKKNDSIDVFSFSANTKEFASEWLEARGLEAFYIQDSAEAVKQSYKTLSNTAIQTIIIVFVIIYFFVGFAEAAIASILLPLAFFVTFIVLDVLGLSLNFLTNFSLVLTLGIAIDTIIVIVEGASERLRLGYNKRTAVLLAIKELKTPLISGTLTTLFVFLPLIFLPGVIGKFLAYIPITVFSTVLAGLILSLTVSSTLFYFLSKEKKTYEADAIYEDGLDEEEKNLLLRDRANKTQELNHKKNIRETILEYLSNKYEKTLFRILNSTIGKLLVIFVPIILLILSIVFLSPRIGFTLFPISDNNFVSFTISAPTGSDTKVMKKIVNEIDKPLINIPEIKVYTLHGSGDELTLDVELLNKNIRNEKNMRSVFEVEEEILTMLAPIQTKGYFIESKVLSAGPPTGKAVGIDLQTTDLKNLNTLRHVASDFEKFLLSQPTSKNTGLSMLDTPGQFVFKYKEDVLSYLGVTKGDIAPQLYSSFSKLDAGSVPAGSYELDLEVFADKYRDELTPSMIMEQDIELGQSYNLGDLMEWEFVPGISSVQRKKGSITVSVESDVISGATPSELQLKLNEFASTYDFPEGITYSVGGENVENQDLINSMIQSFFIAVFAIFTLLVLQFNSYRQPLIILYSVIVGLLGVNVGLYLTGNPYSLTFGIGFIALTGVVINDAIILVDKTNRSIERLKNSNPDATMQDFIHVLADSAKSRLHPILVTTLTTVFGVLPLALEDEFWAGLGFTIVFGLTTGSLLTLYVMPTLYYYVSLRKRIKK